MCLACAVPVRGTTLGAECLAAVLGPEAPAPAQNVREPGSAARTLWRAALLVALLATALPWSRFGAGSEPFGAWGDSPRWSMLVAVAALVGLGVSLARSLAERRSAASDLLGVAFGSVIAVGSVLAIARPPPFSSPWLGPWLALGAGVAAIAGGIAARRSASRHEAAHV